MLHCTQSCANTLLKTQRGETWRHSQVAEAGAAMGGLDGAGDGEAQSGQGGSSEAGRQKPLISLLAKS